MSLATYPPTSNPIALLHLPYILALGVKSRRTSGQAHELCSDRALRRPAVARCAAPPRAAPLSFPAFRCLHLKRAVALLGH